MRPLNRTLLSSVAIGFFLAATLPAVAAQLVANGGFETGSFSGWITPSTLPTFYLVHSADTANGAIPSPASNGYYVFDGTYAAQLGTTSPNTLSQTFAGVAGQSYVLSFWLNGDPIGSSAVFDAAVNGADLKDLINPVFGWNQYAVAFIGAASNTLTFSFDDPNGIFLSLDDVSVVPGTLSTAATPEPSSVALLGIGICGLMLIAQRRKLTPCRAFNS